MSGTTECMTCRKIFTDMESFNKHPCVSTAKKEEIKKEDSAKTGE
jgi:hypothetical protein